MFRIGEFSKLTQVTIRMLRYYDETGLLKPKEVDSQTGYRLYSVDQIPVLNKIIFLRDSGFNVAEISLALEHESDDFIAKQFEAKHAEIERHIRAEQEMLRKLELARKNLMDGKCDMHYQVLLKSVPGYQVLSYRKIIPNYYAEGELWEALSRFARQEGIQVSGQAFSIYHDTGYKEENVDVELCAVVEKMGIHKEPFTFRVTEPVPTMACTMVYGSFSNIAGAYRSFAGWLQDNSGYRMCGPDRQIVHRGPWNENDPRNYLTEIQIPVTMS